MSKEIKKVTMDATGKRIGRLATDIVIILSGKDSPHFMPNKIPDTIVSVTNASHMQITDKKKKGKIYDRYTGFFGGRRELTLNQMIEKKGYSEVLRKAVYGMLSDNRLRSKKMKRLHIKE